MKIVLTSPGSHRLGFLKFFDFIFQDDLPEDFLDLATAQTRDPYYYTNNKWKSVQDLIFKEISRKFKPAVSRSILQNTDYRYRYAFQFIMLSQKLYPKTDLQFVIVAPTLIRQALEAFDIKINHKLSSFFWQIDKIANTSHIAFLHLKKLVMNFANLEKTLFGKHPQIPPINTLMIGLGEPEIVGGGENKLDIKEFLKHTKDLGPFLKTNTYLILRERQGEGEIKTDAGSRTCFSKNPFHYLHASKNPCVQIFFEFLEQLVYLVLLPFSFFTIESMIIDEYVLVPKIRQWIKTTRVQNITFTNSVYNRQPLWLELCKKFNCKIWMVCYSGYPYYYRYKDEPDIKIEPEPVDRFWFTDHFVIWGRQMADYLTDYGYDPKKMVVSGPIVFAKPIKPRSLLDLSAKKKTIAVFDVLCSNLRISVGRVGVGYYHSHRKNMTRMLNEIYDAALEVFGRDGFEIIMKSKRNPSRFHDLEYLDFLNLDFAKRPGINIMDPMLNPQYLAAKSHFSISAPFTSTADIAFHMKIPSAYYDPTATLCPIPNPEPGPELIGGYDELVLWMKGLNR